MIVNSSGDSELEQPGRTASDVGDRERPATHPARARLKLAAAVLVMTWVWLVMLPWFAARPLVERRLQFLKEKGIDPSAMYYTELEAMDPILAKLESRK